jgi:hypothetical protein
VDEVHKTITTQVSVCPVALKVYLLRPWNGHQHNLPSTIITLEILTNTNKSKLHAWRIQGVPGAVRYRLLTTLHAGAHVVLWFAALFMKPTAFLNRVSIAQLAWRLGYGLDSPGLYSGRRQETSLVSDLSRPAVELARPGVISLRAAEGPWGWSLLSPVPRVTVRGAIPLLSPYTYLHGLHRDDSNFFHRHVWFLLGCWYTCPVYLTMKHPVVTVSLKSLIIFVQATKCAIDRPQATPAIRATVAARRTDRRTAHLHISVTNVASVVTATPAERFHCQWPVNQVLGQDLLAVVSLFT